MNIEWLFRDFNMDPSTIARKRFLWGAVTATVLLGTLLSVFSIGAMTTVGQTLLVVLMLYAASALISFKLTFYALLLTYKVILPLRRAWPGICDFMAHLPTRLPGAIRRGAGRAIAALVIWANLGLVFYAWWPAGKSIAVHVQFSSSAWISAMYATMFLVVLTIFALLIVLRLVIVVLRARQHG